MGQSRHEPAAAALRAAGGRLSPAPTGEDDRDMSDDTTPQTLPAGESGSRQDAGTRREFILAGAAMAATTTAASAAATDGPRGHSARDASNPGPDDSGPSALSPASFSPPRTDHGDVPTFWASFATAHRRVPPPPHPRAGVPGGQGPGRGLANRTPGRSGGDLATPEGRPRASRPRAGRADQAGSGPAARARGQEEARGGGWSAPPMSRVSTHGTNSPPAAPPCRRLKRGSDGPSCQFPS